MLPGQSKGLYSDGRHLSVCAGIPALEHLDLIVSMRRYQSGSLKHDVVEAARTRSLYLERLRDRAFTCPVPLSLNGQRIDTLAYCPQHGFGKHRRTFEVGFSPQDEGLKIPEATWERVHPLEKNPHLIGFKDLLEVAKVEPGGPGLYWILSGHFQLDGKAFELLPGSSYLHWVTDGVVTESEELSRVRTRGASIGVFLSSEGLGHDLSGFTLLESEARQARASRAKATITSHLQLSESEELLPDLKRRARQVGGVLGLLGLGLGVVCLLIHPVAGLMVTARRRWLRDQRRQVGARDREGFGRGSGAAQASDGTTPTPELIHRAERARLLHLGLQIQNPIAGGIHGRVQLERLFEGPQSFW